MEKDWFVFCSGVVPAISGIIRKLTTPAEQVLLLTPVYDSLFASIVDNGRQAVSYTHLGIIAFSMCPEDVEYVLSLPFTSVISDALYGGGSHPHPRLYGAFPKVIEEYVCRRKLLTLQAVSYTHLLS